MSEIEQAAQYLEAKAAAIEALVHPERIQPHTRLLASEEQRERAQGEARQLRIAADELRNGFHLKEEEEE